MKLPSSDTAGSKQSAGAYWGNSPNSTTLVRLKISPVVRSFRKMSRRPLLSLGVITFEADEKTTHRPLAEMDASKQPALGSTLARLREDRTMTLFRLSPRPTSSPQHGRTRNAAAKPAARQS